jgi:hypothetical protein
VTGARERWISGLLRALPIYLAFATSLGFVDYRIRAHADHAFTNYIPAVIAGTEDPPGKYRVLAPWIYEATTRPQPDQTLGEPEHEEAVSSRRAAWVVFRWASLLAVWIAVHAYLTAWFPWTVAVAANGVLAAMLPLTFTNGWGHPDHFIELVLLAGCAAGIARGASWFVLAAGVALATLNRETSAIIVMLYALAEPLTAGRAVRAAGLGAVWLAVTIALRVGLGWMPYDPRQFGRNIEFLQGTGRGILPAVPYNGAYAWFFVVILVAMGALVIWSWRRQPRHARAAAAVVVPAFAAVCVLFSSVVETRVFSPILVLLLPGVMFSLFEPKHR